MQLVNFDKFSLKCVPWSVIDKKPAMNESMVGDVGVI